MRRRIAIFLAIAGLIGLAAGVWFAADGGVEGFARVARRADQVILHEGLPHGMYEESLLAQELQTKEVRELGRYPFYKEPLVLNDEDAKRLAVVLGNSSTFHPFTIEKPCGGFHPDYAVEFRHGLSNRYALICFGCGEVIITGFKEELRHELEKGARAELEDILLGYRKHRPPWKIDR